MPNATNEDRIMVAQIWMVSPHLAPAR
jgi:hypothetical protein